MLRPYSISSSRSLCFGGRFLLSAMTRVVAGAIPDFLARRRASVAAFSFFLRRFIFVNPATVARAFYPELAEGQPVPAATLPQLIRQNNCPGVHAFPLRCHRA
jgi:hypothetical protein